ncbi:peptidoglycan editing factor PgeF [Xylophilus sp. Kf1]|nr:peptidoglycan editing factor PgeF [Xylophilus sp. Kf1]
MHIAPDPLRAHGWLIPEWPAPPQVRAVFTTRAGGVSAAPFDRLNLGDHVGDDAAAVAENRRRFSAATGAGPVFLQQPHGIGCVDLDHWTPGTPPSADACTTTVAARACTVMVADCLPLLFCDPRGRVVGAAHAGWRGLAAGVVEACVAALRARLGDAEAPLLAWLGPCIGPAAFEVGDEVRSAFTREDAGARACFEAGAADGKFLADLAGLARRRLARAGVRDVFGNDGAAGWCTVADASRFFSHRRDAARLGSTGRMAAGIWRVG